MIKDIRLKLIITFILILINTVCVAIVFFYQIQTTPTKIYGSFFAIGVVALAAAKFPLRFYLLSHIFIFFASSLGSCINLYHSVDVYDIIVHYLSGLLLFEGGYLVIEKIYKKRNHQVDSFLKRFFALFFSCACAAFWEIYEFGADNLAHARMQGSKENTMFDIIAGVLGSFTYFLVSVILSKIKLRKSINNQMDYTV